jgi:hypothetical protein
MVTARCEETLSSGISMDYLVFGPIKYGTVNRQHGGNGEDFFGTLVSETHITF